MIHLVILSVLISCAFSATLKNDSSSFFEGRIVGGVPVAIQDYPYQVSVQKNDRHICGGSVISSYFVLTAAHCTNNFLSSVLKRYSVRVGSTYQNSGGTVFRIARIHQNKNYPYTNDYDVSLLELENSLTPLMLASPSTVKAIPLPSAGYPVPVGELIRVTGWGSLTTNGVLVTELRGVEVPYIGRASCQEAYLSAEYTITDKMMCVGYLGVGGKDSCAGDSGGPAVYNGVQVGVASWGYGCGDPKYPGVYVDLTNQQINSWIISII
ncbi:trypsin [Sergentomyia squamirostris]